MKHGVGLPERVDSGPHSATTTAAVYRSDVEGLRAVAVLLVMLFHAGFPLLSGGFVGVDVFFVISGFLITGLLWREIERTGKVAYGRFYARRIRRLLPAGTAVLVFVALASWLWLPDAQWGDVSGEIVAATFFVSNWVFASKAMDYFASDGVASPVQNYWSLSVEEQFYLLWPTLLVILAGTALLRSSGVRQRLLLGMASVFGLSLAYSWYLTGEEASRAYFVSTTRVWELALGGMIALTAHRWASLPGLVLRLLAWGGLFMILAAGFWFTTTTPFPGLMALIPTLGTALVIASYTSGRFSAAALLSWAPLVWIGGLSYSLYLWHWPLAVLVPSVFPDGGEWLVGFAVAFSVVPAWLSFRLLEHPIRSSRFLKESTKWTITLGVVCLSFSVLAAFALQKAGTASREDSLTATQSAITDETILGAAAMYLPDTEGNILPDWSPEFIVPDPAWAAKDHGLPAPGDCEGRDDPTTPRVCSQGRPDHPIRLVLVGDSHARQWYEALKKSAEQDHFYLEMITRSQCPWTDETVWSKRFGRPYTECAQWRERVLTRLLADPPEIVVASAMDRYSAIIGGERLPPEEASPAVAEGMVRIYDQLAAAGTEVVHVVDTPKMSTLVPECVRRYRDDLQRCAIPEDDAFVPWGISQALRSLVSDQATVVSMKDGMCAAGVCPGVIGNVVAYYDDAHMTGTYAKSFAPFLLQRLKTAAPSVF